MREIKFRAWDKSNNCWINMKEVAIDPDDGGLLSASSDELVWSNYGNYELIQFTGLKDKNGKEIYEGDIVEWKPTVLDRKMKGKVIWHEESGAWFVLDDIGVYDHLGLLLNTKTKVIGNIYENPELLKK